MLSAADSEIRVGSGRIHHAALRDVAVQQDLWKMADESRRTSR
jgi:hypothetical protein